MEKNITMKDIANYLNIDRTTVSKAITGSGRVSAETIERVKQAAEELGYRKDSFASGLMTGKNSVLGIILPEITRGIYAAFVESFQRVARSNGYGVILYYANRKGDDVMNIIDLLKQQRVSGATFISGSTDVKHDKYLIRLVNSGMAVNTTRRSLIHEQIDSIRFDNSKAGYDLTQYLIELGHTRIVFVCNTAVTGTGKERMDGYMAAMRHSGLQPLLIEDKIAFTESAGDYVQFSYHLIKKVWSSLERPSAFIGVNDNIALGILFVLKEKGLAIPEDISLAGFDDLYADLTVPQMTSMRMPVREAGEWAAELLVERIKRNEKPASAKMLDYEMIKRETIAPFRAKIKD